VKELIFAEFNKLKDTLVSDKELSESKAQLKGKLLLAQENMSNRMTRLAKSEIYYDRYIPLDELIQEIDLVTAVDIQNFSIDFFDTSIFSETLLLPEEK
jgi:predicted Zn-dependent peptidase